MLRFLSFLVSLAIFIYVGVWVAIGLFIYTVYVWFIILIWNKVLSEYLPLPEIGFFAGFIVSFFIDVIAVTIWAIYGMKHLSY